jgi:glutaryl-CoA dehydrogenase
MAEMGRFNWQDPLDLESQLTEEERMIRDAARAYAQDKLQPRVTGGVPARSSSTARS